MKSDIIPNENIFYNVKDYQKRRKFKFHRNKFFRKIDNYNGLKFKSFNKKEDNKSSMRNLKRTYINYFNSSEFHKNSFEPDIIQINHVNKRSILPLLSYDAKQNKNFLSKNNIKINKDKSLNNKYLYLEYKIESGEDIKNNDAIYIEIDPNQIISSLTGYSKIREVFKILTKKINQRNNNMKNKNNYNSRIGIDEILYYLDKNKRNNIINNITNDNNSFYNKSEFNITSIYPFPNKQIDYKYSAEDLFLLDIINKVIKKAIFLQDKRNININEAFMLKEYKNQIKNLNIFFEEKINEKNIGGLIISRNGKLTQSQKDINLKEKLLHKDNLKGDINRANYKNGMNIKVFYNLNKPRDKPISNSVSTNNIEKENEKSLNKNKEIKILFQKPKLNIYEFEIGPKINIIDFDELKKISRQKFDIKNKSNIKKNIPETLLGLIKTKISFENHIINEKANILKDKSNIFSKKNIDDLYSRNIYKRKFNRKKLFIRNEPSINDIHQNIVIKQKNIDDSKNEENIDPKDSISSDNNSEYIKILSKGKINMENLGKKKDFEVTKVCFNKDQGKIKEKNYKKIKVIDQKKKENNFSFLNTIYGKINSQRKMKINEIDYKEKIKQRGYQLLFDIFQQNPKLELSKNINVEKILIKNINTNDKGTSTREDKLFSKTNQLN